MAAISNIVTVRESRIAITLGIFFRQRNKITGFSKIEIIAAKTSGIIISWPAYKIKKKTVMPMRICANFRYTGILIDPLLMEEGLR
jgi:hypothetical protein